MVYLFRPLDSKVLISPTPSATFTVCLFNSAKMNLVYTRSNLNTYKIECVGFVNTCSFAISYKILTKNNTYTHIEASTLSQQLVSFSLQIQWAIHLLVQMYCSQLFSTKSCKFPCLSWLGKFHFEIIAVLSFSKTSPRMIYLQNVFCSVKPS